MPLGGSLPERTARVFDSSSGVLRLEVVAYLPTIDRGRIVPEELGHPPGDGAGANSLIPGLFDLCLFGYAADRALVRCLLLCREFFEIQAATSDSCHSEVFCCSQETQSFKRIVRRTICSMVGLPFICSGVRPVSVIEVAFSGTVPKRKVSLGRTTSLTPNFCRAWHWRQAESFSNTIQFLPRSSAAVTCFIRSVYRDAPLDEDGVSLFQAKGFRRTAELFEKLGCDAKNLGLAVAAAAILLLSSVWAAADAAIFIGQLLASQPLQTGWRF